MAGIVERGLNIFADVYNFPVTDGFEEWDACLRVFRGVQGNLRIGTSSSLTFVPPPLELRVFLQYMGGIKQYYLGDFGSRGSTVDRTVKALPHKPGQQAAMVKMGMGQKDRVYVSGINRERSPVSRLEFSFLVDAAVHQNLEAVDFNEVLRASDILGRAQKSQSYFQDFILNYSLSRAIRRIMRSEKGGVKGGCMVRLMNGAEMPRGSLPAHEEG